MYFNCTFKETSQMSVSHTAGGTGAKGQLSITAYSVTQEWPMPETPALQWLCKVLDRIAETLSERMSVYNEA